MRYKPIRIFELGLGTNNINLPSNMGANGRPGASLYGWAEFFPNAKVFGADIDRDILFRTERIETFYCDQTSVSDIKTLWEHPSLSENFDIIVEDGLHKFDANVCFLENSLHKVRSGGYYIVEDIDVSNIDLFSDKMKTWRITFPNCDFTLLRIPCNNWQDNNLLVVKVA